MTESEQGTGFSAINYSIDMKAALGHAKVS